MASERVTAADLAVLYQEDARVPMHVGSVLVLSPPRGGLDYERLVTAIEQRLGQLPRYRQRLVAVPANLSGPRWVDDAAFDVTFHVRRSALPSPGDHVQLAELTSRLMARRLDRDRPLWEIYLVEGLAGGKVALITKTHSALVDGVDGLEIGEVLLDSARATAAVEAEPWVARPAPGGCALLRDVAREAIVQPASVLESAAAAISNARSTGQRVVHGLRGVATSARWALRSSSPINIPVSGQRRFAMVAGELKDFQLVKERRDCTVNDVVLATIAGALRAWLIGRGETIRRDAELRALVPVTMIPLDAGASYGRSTGIESIFVDLPIGDPDPVRRLAEIRYSMNAHRETGRAVAAAVMTGMSRFAPPTVHALGARLAQGLSSRAFSLVITNVPGPQRPVYAAGARLREVYPVVPLGRYQGLAIGATSYDGTVYFGVNADRDRMDDVAALAGCITSALEELKEAAL